MPTPRQTRDQRLKQLLTWAKKQNKTPTYNQILSQATTLYPLTTERTLKDYTRSIIRAIKKKEKL